MDVFSTELGIRLSFGKNFGISGGGGVEPFNTPPPPVSIRHWFAPQRQKNETQTQCFKCFVRNFLCEALGWLSDTAETCGPYSVFVLTFWHRNLEFKF
jgi:hypothetical protein